MPKSLKLIVEALLFASERPLTPGDFREWLPDVDTAAVRSALRVLEYEYEAMGRSFVLKQVAGGYQFRSRPEYGPYILRMLQAQPARLSRAALETLAIIAYKQPIVRHEIEGIRGVDSGGILKGLMEKGLIRVMGRKDLPGRPLIYGTTKRFLEVFDLDSIDSLPRLKEIKGLGSEDHGTQQTGSLFGRREGGPPEEAGEDRASGGKEEEPGGGTASDQGRSEDHAGRSSSRAGGHGAD